MQTKTEETYEDRQHAMRVSQQRSEWNAPLLHVKTHPTFEGEFGSAMELIKTLLSSPKGSTIALVGTRGCGKTQLAVEAMKLITEQEKSALFDTAIGFFMKIKASWSKGSDVDEMDVVNKFQRPKLLVIDEFGKRGENDWQNNLLFEVINCRYNRMLHTILIDNRTPAEFEATVGPSISSRMTESGGIIDCNWKSFRDK